MLKGIELLALAVLASSTTTCPHGSCVQAPVESTVMLQRRKGRRIDMRLVEQTTSEEKTSQAKVSAKIRSGVQDLVEVTKQMLHEGTTSDELTFAEYSLQELNDTVLPALLLGHEHDQKLIDDTMLHFHLAEADFNERRTTIESLQSAEAEAKAAYQQCHADMADTCNSAISCETNRSQLWNLYKEQERQYLEWVRVIKGDWCSVNHDRSELTWMSTQEFRYETYVQLGEEVFRRLEVHEERQTMCQEKNRSLSSAVAGCDLLKTRLEESSCARLSEYNSAIDELDTSWKVATDSFDEVIPYVKTRHEVRSEELKALSSIKCLLKNIVNRSLKPCDDDESGEYSHIITDCESFWQIDIHFDLAGNLSIPELPQQPGMDMGPVPCSSEYLIEHYGDSASNCMDHFTECIPCSEPEQRHCNHGQVWNICGSECTKTCEDPEPSCTEQCVAKCECPADKPLLKNGLCISAAHCEQEGKQDVSILLELTINSLALNSLTNDQQAAIENGLAGLVASHLNGVSADDIKVVLSSEVVKADMTIHLPQALSATEAKATLDAKIQDADIIEVIEAIPHIEEALESGKNLEDLGVAELKTSYNLDTSIGLTQTDAARFGNVQETDAASVSGQVLMQMYSGEVGIDGEFGAPSHSP